MFKIKFRATDLELSETYIPWFRSLTAEQQQDLTRAIRWYAFHCDTYLNAVYRNRPYPVDNLIRHASELFYDSDHLRWVGSDMMFQQQNVENRWCNERFVTSPFGDFIGKSRFPLRQYIQRIKEVTSFMHTVFTYAPMSFRLPSAIYFFRGLRVPKGSMIQNEVVGITSVSTDVDVALTFGFQVYGPPTATGYPIYDARTNDTIIIAMLLPAGTRVIPANLCTIQDESEFLLLSQGSIRITKSGTRYITAWNNIIDENGKYRERPERHSDYRQLNLNQSQYDEYKRDHDTSEGPAFMRYQYVEAEFVETAPQPTYTEFKVATPGVTAIDELEVQASL